jgi:hypothetical protein
MSMGKLGYISSVKETLKYLGVCAFTVVSDENGIEYTTHCRETDLEWYIGYLTNKGHDIVDVSKLDSHDHLAVAKRLTDKYAATHGFKFEGSLEDLAKAI